MRRVETYKSGMFDLQVGVNPNGVQPLLDRVEDAHERFSSIPIMADVASMLEKEVIASSVFGTNTIEGGTLTEEETEAVIDGISDVKDEKNRRVINIKNAYDMATGFAEYCLGKNDEKSGSFIAIKLEEVMITDLHGVITDSLAHPHNVPGAYRDNQKGQLTKVGDAEHGGVYTAPKCRPDIELLMKAYIEWINSDEIIGLPPLIRASLAHYYFERIHPFWDGNGRVGRVIEMLILKCAGYKYAHFALSKFYQENIDEYFSVFSSARKAEKKKDSYPNTVFIEFFLTGMFKVINRLHDRANRLIAYVLYENVLNSRYQEKKINQRQYTIVANLLPHGIESSITKMAIQPWYLSLYKTLTAKTRQRDLKGLVSEGLIDLTEDKKIRLLIP